MKRLPLLLALLTTPAFGETKQPSTVVLPSGLVLDIRKYLGRQPLDDVLPLVSQLETCVRAQAPGAPVAAVAACPGIPMVVKPPEPAEPPAK